MSSLLNNDSIRTYTINLINKLSCKHGFSANEAYNAITSSFSNKPTLSILLPSTITNIANNTNNDIPTIISKENTHLGIIQNTNNNLNINMDINHMNIPKRINVEYNCTEVIVAVMKTFDNLQTFDDIYNFLSNLQNKNVTTDKLFFNKPQDIDAYILDMKRPQKRKIIDNFILNFHKLNIDDNAFHFKKQDILSVFISGKHNSHQIINVINNGIDDKQTKSDIYFQLHNNTFTGVSVKQSKDATKSNFSVSKLLGKEKEDVLKQVFTDYMNSNGFSSSYNDKNNRTNINKLFHVDNVYFDKMREFIKQDNHNIIRKLVSYLFSSDVPYPIYEFDGESITRINSNDDLSTSSVTFEDHQPFYLTNKGIRRNAAKLFYLLVVGNKKYRVEVRWKGSFNASPQFLTHKIS
jgi:hypothetical protein